MPRTTRRSESAEGVCPVCSEVIIIYAIGMCDHPVCYRCSTRMRVLCENTLCAICRVDLPKVIFRKNPAKYVEIDSTNFHVFRKEKIYFESDAVQDAFYDLLDHSCSVCEEKRTFRTFNLLRDHMRKEHSLFYCEICVSHLQIFSHERRYYDRARLGTHRRMGDEDDKSHKGHPLCEFCDERFLDNDELVRHLRKEHYFCHFCDADGINNQFYSEYSSLREHFKDSHYLCEEADCLNAKFTNAFRSEIDLKGHMSAEHLGRVKKSVARQVRTIDIDINYAPRPGSRPDRDRDRDRGRPPRGRPAQYEDAGGEEPKQGRGGGGGRGRGGRGRGRGRGMGGFEAEKPMSDREAAELQKALVTSESDTKMSVMPVPQSSDFPTLDGSVVRRVCDVEEAPAPAAASAKEVNRDNMAMHVARSQNFSVAEGSMGDEQFPSLGPGDQPAAYSAKSAWAFKADQKDFPALGGNSSRASVGSAAPGWGSKQQSQVKHSQAKHSQAKQQVRPASKPRPAPAPVQPILNSRSDFPSLSSIGSGLLSGKAQPSNQPHSRSSHPSSTNGPSRSRQIYQDFIDEEEDYPTLGGGVSIAPPAQPNIRTISRQELNSSPKSSKSGSVYHDDGDFPTLGGGRRVAPAPAPASPKRTRPKAPRGPAQPKPKSVEVMFDEEFPSLGGRTMPAPTPTVAAPSGGKTQQPESVAMKKLLSQQKKEREAEAFLLRDAPPADTPPPEQPQPLPAREDRKKPVKSSSQEKAKPETKSKTQARNNYPAKTEDRNSPALSHKIEKAPAPAPTPTDSFTETESRKKKKGAKKVEKFEDDFPSLGGAPAPSLATITNWGSGDNKPKPQEAMDHTDSMLKIKTKKKNKKDKNESNKLKAEKEEAEPEPTWGYIPDFVPPPQPKKEVKEPPGLVYKKTRDKEAPWGEIQLNNNTDFPSLFKPETDKLVTAIKSVPRVSAPVPAPVAPPPGANMTLAGICANLKGPSVEKVEVEEEEEEDDFPELGVSTATAPPPGLAYVPPPVPAPAPAPVPAKPPPGFSGLPNDFPAPAPPPGFCPAPLPPAPMEEEVLEYCEPPHFMDRNHNLIAGVQRHLLDDNDKFQTFKKASGKFRQALMSGSDYYTECKQLLGSEGFLDVFTELIVLLPDINKQQELLQAHRTARQPQRGTSTKRDKAERKAWGNIDTTFTTCPTCGQVLALRDVSPHSKEHHLDTDFPALDMTPGNKYGMSAWVVKSSS